MKYGSNTLSKISSSTPLALSFISIKILFGNFFIDIHTRYGDLIKFFNKRGFVLEDQRVVLKKFFNGEIY